MTDTERLAHDARIPADLAALVVLEANRAHISVRQFRRPGRPARLTPHKRRAIVTARDAGFSWWAIARAMNRDHTTCLFHYKQAKAIS